MNARFTLVCIAALTLPGHPVATADASTLQNNPFARPAHTESTTPREATTQNEGNAQPLQLRATMVTTGRRLADVGGRILKPGDEIQGYTLLAILEDRAVFSRGDSQVTIWVKNRPADDDE